MRWRNIALRVSIAAIRAGKCSAALSVALETLPITRSRIRTRQLHLYPDIAARVGELLSLRYRRTFLPFFTRTARASNPQGDENRKPIPQARSGRRRRSVPAPTAMGNGGEAVAARVAAARVAAATAVARAAAAAGLAAGREVAVAEPTAWAAAAIGGGENKACGGMAAVAEAVRAGDGPAGERRCGRSRRRWRRRRCLWRGRRQGGCLGGSRPQ